MTETFEETVQRLAHRTATKYTHVASNVEPEYRFTEAQLGVFADFLRDELANGQEPKAWVTPLMYGSQVTFYKPPKPPGWDEDDDGKEWYCRPLYEHPAAQSAPAGVPDGWEDDVTGLITELKGGSNWLSGKHDVYSYSRAPKIAAAVLSALDGMSVAELVERLQDAHKWKREGFGNWKDVSTETNDAPFKAAALLSKMLSAAPAATANSLLNHEQISSSAPADAVAKDAERYRMVRRGQHWSVIDGIGNDLRAEALDAAIDAAMQGKESGND